MASGYNSFNNKGPKSGVNQKSRGDTVYGFSNDVIFDEEEINTDDVEPRDIRARNKKLKSKGKIAKQDLYIQKEVKYGESLRSIALKYSCQVAELKRINGLISDQDFYGLSSIKVPVKQHGLLTEVEHETKIENSSDTFHVGADNLDAGGSDSDYDDSTVNSRLLAPDVRTVSIRGTLSQQSNEAVNFLSKMDTDIRNIVTSTKSRLDSLEDVKTRLTCRRFFPLESKKPNFGADFGIRWWNILIIMIIIVVVAPSFLFIYYETVQKRSDSGTIHNSTVHN